MATSDITAKWILDKLVPPDSPHADQVQGVVIALIHKHQDYASDLVEPYDDNLSNISHHDSPHDKLRVSQCIEIIEHTRSEGMSKTWAVPYMLALFTQVYRDKSLDSPEWRFMSGYLQTMFLLTTRNDEHYRKIDTLGVRVRMGLKPDNVQSIILSNLIEWHTSTATLEHILDKLRDYEIQIKHEEATGKDYKLGSKIGQIRLAYEVIIKDLDFISKAGGGQRRSAKTKQSQNQTHLLPNLDNFSDNPLDNDNAPVRAWQPLIKDDSNVAQAETQSDEDAFKLLDNAFRPSKKTAKSAELQRWEIRNQARHSRRNQFAFPSNLRVLNLASYQQVFASLWLRLDDVALPQKRAITVILLSLLSGRKISDLIHDLKQTQSQRDILSHHGKRSDVMSIIGIKAEINVTANNRSALKKLQQSFGNTFYLPLPSALQTICHYNFEVNKQDIDDAIATIKEDLGMPLLSRQHIEAALAVIITHYVGEPLHADLITGVDVKHSAPLYYTSIATESLITTYAHATSRLIAHLPQEKQLAFKSELINDAHVINKPVIGSDMVLKEKVCQKFFQELATHVEKYNDATNHSLSIHENQSIKQFNAYGLWLWHVLQLLTGIRPVNDAPGFLNQFNFKQHLLWISDKANKHNSRQGRLIPLADFVATAVQNYKAYLQRFASKHNMLYPEHPLLIEDILQSKKPLLTFFNYNPLGFIAYKPSRVQSLLGKALRHQDNWLRHQLRSLFTNRADETLICAIFGHEHPEQELMHPFSSSSMSDLKSIKTHIDDIAKELTLKQVEVT